MRSGFTIHGYPVSGRTNEVLRPERLTMNERVILRKGIILLWPAERAASVMIDRKPGCASAWHPLERKRPSYPK